MNQFKSKISNNRSEWDEHWGLHNEPLPCENPECARTDRPLFIWHGENGTGAALFCDICTVKALPRQSQEIIDEINEPDPNDDDEDDWSGSMETSPWAS